MGGSGSDTCFAPTVGYKLKEKRSVARPGSTLGKLSSVAVEAQEVLKNLGHRQRGFAGGLVTPYVRSCTTHIILYYTGALAHEVTTGQPDRPWVGFRREQVSVVDSAVEMRVSCSEQHSSVCSVCVQ